MLHILLTNFSFLKKKREQNKTKEGLIQNKELAVLIFQSWWIEGQSIYIHLVAFQQKEKGVKPRDFKFTKLLLFFKLQFISSSGHSREKVSVNAASQSPRAVA